jgi:hypothetical protein
MARMLYQKDSSPFSIRMVKRHIRLCSQNPGCSQFPTAIQPFLKNLVTKRAASDAADEECSYSLDLIYLRERELDDGVRTVFKSAEIYDEAHVGARTLIAIFPLEKYSDFIDLNYEKKSAEAEKIAGRIDHLSSTHSLYPHAEFLRKKIIALDTALGADKDTRNELSIAKTQEEIARAELRKAYENNYLEGRKLLGSKDVEKLFPIIPRGEQEEEDSGTKTDEPTK